MDVVEFIKTVYKEVEIRFNPFINIVNDRVSQPMSQHEG